MPLKKYFSSTGSYLALVIQLKFFHSCAEFLLMHKKDILLQKTKRRPHQEVGGAILWYKQPHTSWVGSPRDWKVIGSQRLTYRSESSEPHIKPSRVGIWHWEKEPESIWHWRSVRLMCRSSTGLGEMETPVLKGAHRLLRALGPRAKQSLHRNLGQTWLWFLKDLLGKQGLNVACCGGRTVETKL